MPVVTHPDPFSAVLLTSPALDVTEEQKSLIQDILDIACSDSRFSQKAYIAITRVLVNGVTKAPVVTSLTPSSAVLGDPSFTLHVNGTDFVSGSIIVFAGHEEPTTFVSATELTTGVDMSVWLGPDVLPVSVLNPDGVLSDPQSFTFTDGTAVVASKSPEVKHAPASPVKK